MFVFNLSSVDDDEEVISGELHVLLKSPSPSSPSSSHPKTVASSKEEGREVVSQMFRLSPSSITELGVKTVPTRSRGGWQVVSVTSAVKDCLRARSSSSSKSRKSRDLFAMYFGEREEDGSVRPLEMSHVMRMFSRPFLVLFSNASSQNISIDHVSPHFQQSAAADGFHRSD